jgi:hypothetical protein
MRCFLNVLTQSVPAETKSFYRSRNLNSHRIEFSNYFRESSIFVSLKVLALHDNQESFRQSINCARFNGWQSGQKNVS